MLQRLKAFENKQPEIVFSWKDAETEAEGWIVINSLRGGAAGGGTRMRVGLNKHEVVSLAKTMEVKFSVCGPQIGGAKSGINFDPSDPRKRGVLERWYKAALPILKAYYGTGGDLNVDEIKEVLPITGALGLRHCQEGIAVGHYKANEEETNDIIERLQNGVSKVLDDNRYDPTPGKADWVVADMITGWGVTEAARLFYDIWRDGHKGKRVIVQGFGNVGGAAAFYAAQMGFKVVGIIDRTGAILNPEGISEQEISDLLANRDGNALYAPNLIPYEEMEEKIFDVEAEVFLPCARSRILTIDQVDRMLKTGIEVVSCGANVPFADEEIFLGPTAIHADHSMSVIPDFIANCGMARAFAYFMGGKGELSDHEIFQDVTETIRKGLMELYNVDKSETRLWQRGLDVAIDKLEGASNS